MPKGHISSRWWSWHVNQICVTKWRWPHAGRGSLRHACPHLPATMPRCCSPEVVGLWAVLSWDSLPGQREKHRDSWTAPVPEHTRECIHFCILGNKISLPHSFWTSGVFSCSWPPIIHPGKAPLLFYFLCFPLYPLPNFHSRPHYICTLTHLHVSLDVRVNLNVYMGIRVYIYTHLHILPHFCVRIIKFYKWYCATNFILCVLSVDYGFFFFFSWLRF